MSEHRPDRAAGTYMTPALLTKTSSGPAQRELRGEHTSPGLLRVLDRAKDTPAQVTGPIGETLVQTAPAVALLGDQVRYPGHERGAIVRWFTDPAERARYLPEGHERTSRVLVARLRTAATRMVSGRRRHDQNQTLLVFTATPGTPDAEELELLAVLGTDRFPAARDAPG